MTTQAKPFTLESKSMLAKLLATENITIEINPSAKTAAFDVQKRILIIPLWQNISEDLHDMLLVHETGHAIDTPADGWENDMKAIANKYHNSNKGTYLLAAKTFLNVIEDVRIDKRQKRRFPGSRKNYVLAYKELFNRDFFGIANKDVNQLPFIDRANLYYKGGNILLNIKFSPEEKVFLNRMGETETWEQVVSLTDEIYGWAKQKGENRKSEILQDSMDIESSKYGSGDEEYEYSEDFDDESESEELNESDNDTKSFEKSEDDDSDDSEENNSSSDNDDSDESEDSESDESENNGSSSDNDDINEEYIPQSETDRAWEENREKLLANSDYVFKYLSIPEPNMDNIVDDYKKFLADMDGINHIHSSEWFALNVQAMNKFKTVENQTISYMVKEFEMKKAADTYSRIAIAKTGVIDTNKIHSYKYNEDLFRRQTILPQGKNHGFVMFLDWSGSMFNNLQYTMKQLLSLTLFCKRVQIPFEVYLFRENTYRETINNPGTSFKTNKNTIGLDNFKLRNVLSSRMSLTELNKAYAYMFMLARRYEQVDPMTGTPLDSAIVAAEKIINDFRSKNKLQVVNTVFLTDGESNVVRNLYNAYDYHERKKTATIIQDTKTKKQYTIGNEYGNITTILLKSLKERTGCNLIGFYLFDSNFKNMMRRFFPSSVGDQFDKIKETWNENNFVPVHSAGYDEYYIINIKKSKSDINQKLEINANMTKNQMVKAFIKFSEKKSINRLLLNKFIDRITKVA